MGVPTRGTSWGTSFSPIFHGHQKGHPLPGVRRVVPTETPRVLLWSRQRGLRYVSSQGPSQAFGAPTICLGCPSVPEESGVFQATHVPGSRPAWGLRVHLFLLVKRTSLVSRAGRASSGHRLPGSLSAAPHRLWQPLGPPAPPALPPWSCWAARGPQDSVGPFPGWGFGLQPCTPRTGKPQV